MLVNHSLPFAFNLLWPQLLFTLFGPHEKSVTYEAKEVYCLLVSPESEKDNDIVYNICPVFLFRGV